MSLVLIRISNNKFRCHAPLQAGHDSIPEASRSRRTSLEYWTARSRLRQGFDEACGLWRAEALAEAASRAMTSRKDMKPHPRGTKCPGFASTLSLRDKRAQGAPGDGLTHGLPATKKAGGSHHRFSRINRHSLRDGLAAYGALSPVSGLVSHRRPQIIAHELDPSVGESGPRVFAVRLRLTRRVKPTRPSHPAANVRDDREAPLYRARDARKVATDLPDGASEKFFATSLERRRKIESAHEIGRVLIKAREVRFWG